MNGRFYDKEEKGSLTIEAIISFTVFLMVSFLMLQLVKQRCTRGYKRYKETSGLIEWKECQIFHSIFT